MVSQRKTLAHVLVVHEKTVKVEQVLELVNQIEFWAEKLLQIRKLNDEIFKNHFECINWTGTAQLSELNVGQEYVILVSSMVLDHIIFFWDEMRITANQKLELMANLDLGLVIEFLFLMIVSAFDVVFPWIFCEISIDFRSYVAIF